METIVKAKIVTLSNGKRVANFSSPHPFSFIDGTVLPAVSEEQARILSVKAIETELTGGDINIRFELTQAVMAEMDYWVGRSQDDDVDVVFCPLPMITAIRDYKGYYGNDGYLKASPFRTIRIEDRINKLISIDKQCL